MGDEKKAFAALRAFLKHSDMEFVLDQDSTFTIERTPFGGWAVMRDGELFDDRGKLFVCLRNLLVVTIPDLKFRSDPYIFDFDKEFGNHEG